MTFTLFDYQQADVDFLAAHNFTGVNRTEVGGGKTAVAVAAAVAGGHSTNLVIAPQGTHLGEGWEWHVNQLDPSAEVRVIKNSTKEGRNALADLQWDRPGYYLITPQLFTRMDWSDVRPDYAICDEIHLLAAHGKAGSKKLLSLQSGSRLAMSGTPVRNKYENFHTILRWLYPEMADAGQIADRSYFRWLAANMATEYDRFSPTGKKYVGEKIPGELVSRIPCYIQHLRREQCCKFHPKGFLDLEKPNDIREVVELLPQQKKAITDMETKYVTWLQGNPMIADIPVVAQTRVRQMALGMPTVDEFGEVDFSDDCASPKIDKVFDILEELDGEAAVVFTSSRKFARVVTARLNVASIPAFEWSGKPNQTARDQAMVDFKAGKIRVLVAVISAFGTGTNGAQRATKNEIWLDRDIDPTNNVQGEGRIDRLGVSGQVQRFFVIAKDSMDEGRMSAQLEAQILLNRSLRKYVA